MSENEFLNALREEMPEDFGQDLLDKLKAEDKVHPLPQNALWTVAVASIITVIVGAILLLSRQTSETPLNIAQNLWTQRETITPENISQLQPLLTLGYGYAHAIALSPDDSSLAVATSTGIYLHDAHDLNAAPRILGNPLENVEDSEYITTIEMQYTEDGRLLFVVGNLDKLNVFQWDVDAAQFLVIHEIAFDARSKHIQTLSFSPDGTKLFIASCDGDSIFSYPPHWFCMGGNSVEIELLNLETGQTIESINPEGIGNAVAAISPDWTRIAYMERNYIQLLDLETGEIHTILELNLEERDEFYLNGFAPPLGEMNLLRFSPNGEKLGVISFTGDVFGWWELSNLTSDSAPTQVEIPVDMYTGTSGQYLGTHPNTGQVVVAWGSGLRIYEGFAPRPYSLQMTDTQARQLEMTTEGTQFFLLEETGIIRQWDWETLEPVETLTRYTVSSSGIFELSPDSQYFANLSPQYSANGLSFIWQLGESGLLEQTILSSGENCFKATDDVSFSPDGRYVAYFQDSTLWVYDTLHRENRSLLYTNPGPFDIAFREDGTLLVLQNVIGFADVKEISPEMLETGDVPYPLNGIRLERLIISSYQSYIENQRIQMSPDGETVFAYQCQNTVSGDYGASPCLEPHLRLFDTETGQIVAELDWLISNDWAFESVLFSTDSQWLILSTCDISEAEEPYIPCYEGLKTFEIWSIADLQEGISEARLVLPELDTPFTPIQLISLDDNQFMMLSAGWSAVEDAENILDIYTSIQVIDTDGSNEEVYRFQGSYLRIAPDMRYILSAQEGQIQLWGIPSSLVSNQP